MINDHSLLPWKNGVRGWRATHEIPTIATTELEDVRPARGVLGDFLEGAIAGEDDEVLFD